jgi:hypothetical protein
MWYCPRNHDYLCDSQHHSSWTCDRTLSLSLYMLAVGAAIFKPNIAPTVLDKDGSKVIVDPEASSESVMLWF